MQTKPSLSLDELNELKSRVAEALLSLADILDKLNESIRQLEKQRIQAQ